METMRVTAGARVLIVDDDPAALRLLNVRLQALGCAVTEASSGQEALVEIGREEPALVLLDYQMPGLDGIDVLRELRRAGTDLPIIVVTAHGSIETAVEAMKEGAYDYITKPIDPQHLEIVVRKALDGVRLRRGIDLLTEEIDKRYRMVVGRSDKMRQAVETAKKAATSDATVLLLGESGTGKEIFARAIHNWSSRGSQPFVAINCVGLSEHLLESELFGHEKGAFTGADHLKRGKIEVANGGTVFLDEVGDVSSELQTKLLRFLQEREFDRVGGVRPIQVDIRIVAATNRDLRAAVDSARFRADLFYRLNVIPIQLPALRERREDIPELVEYFARKFAHEAKRNLSEVSSEAMDLLIRYHWPGNVRELANILERAVVLGCGPTIAAADLHQSLAQQNRRGPNSLSYREHMEANRRDLILQALAQSDGNRSAAARALGLHEKYLLRLIKALNISERHEPR
jgi:DNA-binding NtrC family response regulator